MPDARGGAGRRFARANVHLPPTWEAAPVRNTGNRLPFPNHAGFCAGRSLNPRWPRATNGGRGEAGIWRSSMKRIFALALLQMTLSALFIGTALVQSTQETERLCINPFGPSDQRVAACTALLESRDPPPNVDRAYILRALAYAQSGQWDRVIEDYSQYLRLHPMDWFSLAGRCEARMFTGQTEAALADCNQALLLHPNDTSALTSRGFLALKTGQLNQAIGDFSAVLRQQPRNAAALYGRGTARLEAGAGADGSADIAAAKALAPQIADHFAPVLNDSPSPTPFKGTTPVPSTEETQRSCINPFGAPDQRIAACTALLEARDPSPNVEIAYFLRALAYEASGQWDRAIEDYDRYLRQHPMDWISWAGRCGARMFNGQTEAALADCNQALVLQPNYPGALLSRGFLYLKTGQLDQAIGDFSAVLQQQPKNAAALFGRGTARLEAGDGTNGNADVAAAKALEPRIADHFAPVLNDRPSK
jgi:tetratricopeptide (TPR) repeat protein